MRSASVSEPLSLEEVRSLAASSFGDMVKGVVDVDRGLLLVDAEMHADLEAQLLGTGSSQESLWGINLYPELPEAEWVEFDLIINIRPAQGNRSRGVDDTPTRERILGLVSRVVAR